MSGERRLPVDRATDLTTMSVMIDGKEINPQVQVIAVSIHKVLNRVPWAVLVVADGDPASGEFTISSSNDFIPGKEIEILAGYHSDEATLFKGLITGQGVRVRSGSPSVLQVTCKDAAAKLTVGRKSAYYVDKKDSEIAKAILQQVELDADVQATQVTHPNMVRTASTDWDFILSRAEANGQVVSVDDGKVTLAAPDPNNASELSLAYGATLMDFEAELDARSQLVSATSVAWDAAEQSIIEEPSEESSFVAQGNLSGKQLATALFSTELRQTHGGAANDQELKAWSDARLLQSRMAKIVGRARCQGFAAIKPGQTVELEGVGERYSGTAYVSGVRHELSASSWETHLQFGLGDDLFSTSWRKNTPPASALLPAVEGLQVGVVTQVGGDPDGAHRIRVRMPIVDTEEDGVWARVASLDAGDQRGAFFRPELGDEVILGFLESDPRAPIVLGMMHSAKKPAPLEASDDNHEKGFVTRSGMKLLFNDDEPSCTLVTPNGNQLQLTDKDGKVVIRDENDNSVELSAEGVVITSSADLKLNASGDIHLEATNINLKASAELKGEGSGGAEVTSSGTTKVMGSLVQIN